MYQFVLTFFSGIVLTIGLIYLGVVLLKKDKINNLLFGLLSFVSGVYYLSYLFHPFEGFLTLFFATIMFVLFPWYLAYESGFVKKKILWVISITGALYYVFALLIHFYGLPNIKYVFSYSVYLLTIFYCIRSIKHIIKNRKKLMWPVIIISGYYTLFTVEEIFYDIMGKALPWRQYTNFTYLDLFPIIIVSFKILLLINDQINKSGLEKEVDFYQKNIVNILNQTRRFVLTLDLNGDIRFANTHFLNYCNLNNSVINKGLDEFISRSDEKQFFDILLDPAIESGEMISKLNICNNEFTVTWSFLKMKEKPLSQNKNIISLFGSNITQQIKTENQLREAYENLEAIKNKLQAENIQLQNNTLNGNHYDTLIGKSPNFNYVLNRIEDVAKLNVTVLLEGETGVGKEVVANTIHKRSRRKDQPFIKVNCAAIPLELIESELFGYEKGAFTGADHTKRGLFELAHKGTLFLDEIGDLPMSMQPKLLRALQEGEIQRLGAEKVIKIDVRILAATNRSLDEEVKLGNFRSDLYYRINVFPITTPPLRKRKEDIPLLVEYFITNFNKKYSRNITTISESLMDTLVNYSWPGNIRQLRNVLERAVITSSESVLKLANPLPLETELFVPDNNKPSSLNLGSLEDFEKSYITKVLNHCNWKIAGKDGSAVILGLPPSTLRSKMKKLGITPVST